MIPVSRRIAYGALAALAVLLAGMVGIAIASLLFVFGASL